MFGTNQYPDCGGVIHESGRMYSTLERTPQSKKSPEQEEEVLQ